MSFSIFNKRPDETYQEWFQTQHALIKSLFLAGDRQALLDNRIAKRMIRIGELEKEFVMPGRPGERTTIYKLAGAIDNYESTEMLLEGCYRALLITNNVPPFLVPYINLSQVWEHFSQLVCFVLKLFVTFMLIMYV